MYNPRSRPRFLLGLIAQLAERVADNDEVPGSSPGGPIAGAERFNMDMRIIIAAVACAAILIILARKGGG